MINFNEFLQKIDPDLYNEYLNESKWIQKAIKKPGSFTSYCGGKVTDSCIEKGKKSKNPTTRRRANLAGTFKKMAKKKKNKNKPN